jgi:phage protein D
MAQQSSNTFRIEVDDKPLADDLVQLIVSAFVDDSLHLPDMFVLAFRDPGRDVLERARIEIGRKITISVVSDAAPGGDKLISNAEVTALEAEFEPTGTLTVVRGLDQSHRLFRGRRTESYQNATYADIAKKVAQRAGLAVGRVDATTEVRTHVSQGNMSDWDFLKDLAAKVGYELTVFDGKLDFRKPAGASGAPAPASNGAQTDQPLQLTMGSTLLRFRSVVTSADQVKEVSVRGWDTKGKKALVGSAPGETKSVQLSVEPKVLASRFGNPVHVSAETPYDSQSEVDAAAKALAEEIAGSFAAFDGVARGNPKLKAGAAVSLGLAGELFDGRYTLTTTRHVYDPLEGYTTWFTVSGRQERSLLGLASGGNGSSSRRAIEGVVPALVTNAKDPDGLCRVKLKFPWLSDSYETDWVRTVQPGGGATRGAMVVPEVNDEVLVAFEHGNLRRPYVIGGLYNGVDKPGMPAGQLVDGGGLVNWRAFVSRTGHRLVFSDESGKEHVELQTGDGKFLLLLDKAKTAIEINSNGKVVIKGTQDVEITSDANIKLKAGANLDIEAGAQLKIKGTQVSVEASGPAAVKGNPIQLN